MLLTDLVTRPLPLLPWHEGVNIPWDDPAFSVRMPAEHLSQAHDAASRRATAIDRHVAWLHRAILDGAPEVVDESVWRVSRMSANTLATRSEASLSETRGTIGGCCTMLAPLDVSYRLPR